MNNKIILIVFTILFISLSACSKKENINRDNTEGDKYIAYYFHPTARCESCINLENYIKEIIDTKYKGKGFVFKPVNIEEKENEHFKKDYNLKFSSIIISDTKSGKWKNLDSIWSYTEDRKKFFEYTENEINNFIKSNN